MTAPAAPAPAAPPAAPAPAAPAAPAPPAAPPAAPVVPPADPAAPAAPAAPPAPPAAPPVAPAPLVLTLPKDSALAPAVVERTAATLSALGLSQDHGQKVLDFVSQEAKAHADLAIAEAQKAHLPGGAVWEQQNADWKTAALADAELGGGKPEQLASNVTLGKRVLATFFAKDAIEFLERTGLASHPDTLRGLVKIGKAMKEDALVVPNAQVPGKRDAADVLYGTKPGTAP